MFNSDIALLSNICLQDTQSCCELERLSLNIGADFNEFNPKIDAKVMIFHDLLPETAIISRILQDIK
ncbi:MAG: hypothetical protein OEY52_00225 [Gammaproteobacteria bacterium]|nr:hypothetical protein [Gammaproteobacteria bacterium]